jgi:hypothetical protein
MDIFQGVHSVLSDSALQFLVSTTLSGVSIALSQQSRYKEKNS